MVNTDFTKEVMIQLSPEMREKGTGLPPQENPLKQKHGGRGDPRSSGPMRGLEHCAEESGSLPRHPGNL